MSKLSADFPFTSVVPLSPPVSMPSAESRNKSAFNFLFVCASGNGTSNNAARDRANLLFEELQAFFMGGLSVNLRGKQTAESNGPE